MEEKRQKILLSETARHGQHRTALPDYLLTICLYNVRDHVYDYIHKHRERLMEEKRQKILLSETARHGQHRTALPDVSTC
ncbi:hypothetical protein PYW07_002375 [Mythimna separata]|uniref:Uncharacterized protein n=1 Tax=Mythimna separata TaxID=271217 RepID=A0AAD8DTD4_MYTSE|nr:hypothetical protein PYW07_002375 [Mythimna separata]